MNTLGQGFANEHQGKMIPSMRNLFGSHANLIVINDEGTVTAGGPNQNASPRAYSRAISNHNNMRN